MTVMVNDWEAKTYVPELLVRVEAVSAENHAARLRAKPVGLDEILEWKREGQRSCRFPL